METAAKKLARMRKIYGATWRIDRVEVERQSGPPYFGDYFARHRTEDRVLQADTADGLEYLLQGTLNHRDK